MNKLRFVSLVSVIICLAIGFVTLRGAQGALPNTATVSKGYRMVSTETRTKDRESTLLAIRTRWVSPEGAWKEETAHVRKGHEGKTQIIFNNRDGQFMSDSLGELHLMGAASHDVPALRDPARLRAHSEFVGMDTLLGFTTYVLRKHFDKDYIEQHFAPDVGSIPLKLIINRSNGNEQVMEAVQVDFLDITSESLARPLQPVKLDFLDAKIRQAEEKGKKEYADGLREVLRAWKNSR